MTTRSMEANALIRAMTALAAKYQTMFKRPPQGYVLGLKDFRLLEHELRLSGQLATNAGFGSLNGLPVFVKITTGVELLMHPDVCERIMYESDLGTKIEMLKAGIVT